MIVGLERMETLEFIHPPLLTGMDKYILQLFKDIGLIILTLYTHARTK